MGIKAKYKLPTFYEFCDRVKIYEDFSIEQMQIIYLVEYKDGIVGTLCSKILVPLDDLGMPKCTSKDIHQAIQECKLETYHKIAQEYDKKNKEVTIEEEKNMSIIMCNDGCLYEMPGEICEHFNLPTTVKAPEKKHKWSEGLPAVSKVETYNQRVVKVTFVDGTFTKSVCSENDHFDLDVGITICAMKRLLGTNSENATRIYNQFMDHVHSVMDMNDREKAEAKTKKEALKAKKRKAELAKAAKKLKTKEEQIDIYKQAILRAQKEGESI